MEGGSAISADFFPHVLRRAGLKGGETDYFVHRSKTFPKLTRTNEDGISSMTVPMRRAFGCCMFAPGFSGTQIGINANALGPSKFVIGRIQNGNNAR